MGKSCKNCSKYDNCCLASFAKGITKAHWYCCDYEPKKKKVKMYAYLKEDDGYYELIWHTNRNLRIERFTRVPSDDKEIEIRS